MDSFRDRAQERPAGEECGRRRFRWGGMRVDCHAVRKDRHETDRCSSPRRGTRPTGARIRPVPHLPVEAVDNAGRKAMPARDVRRPAAGGVYDAPEDATTPTVSEEEPNCALFVNRPSRDARARHDRPVTSRALVLGVLLAVALAGGYRVAIRPHAPPPSPYCRSGDPLAGVYHPSRLLVRSR